MPPPRVALLSVSNTPTCGWGTITHELCSRLAEREELDFTLYLPRDREGPPQEGVTYAERIRCRLPSFVPSFGARHWRRATSFWYPKNIIEECDVIHTLVGFSYAILAGRLARRMNCPCIVSAQGTYAVAPFRKRLNSRMYRWALRKADVVTAPSRFTGDKLQQASGIERHVEVIHNAVNYDRFQNAAGADTVRASVGRDKRIILAVGGLKERKGFDVLIRALPAVRRVVPEALLVIVGDGRRSYRRFLTRLAAEHGVADAVRMVGGKRGEELVAYFQACDVYAHTPRMIADQFEGFGIVYLEAAACGKPVVASRSGGAPEAVVDRQTGIVVPEDDVEATAHALVKILTDAGLAHAMGQRGRRHAQRHKWSWYADKFVRIYQSVAAGAPDRRLENVAL